MINAAHRRAVRTQRRADIVLTGCARGHRNVRPGPRRAGTAPRAGAAGRHTVAPAIAFAVSADRVPADDISPPVTTAAPARHFAACPRANRSSSRAPSPTRKAAVRGPLASPTYRDPTQPARIAQRLRSGGFAMSLYDGVQIVVRVGLPAGRARCVAFSGVPLDRPILIEIIDAAPGRGSQAARFTPKVVAAIKGWVPGLSEVPPPCGGSYPECHAMPWRRASARRSWCRSSQRRRSPLRFPRSGEWPLRSAS